MVTTQCERCGIESDDPRAQQACASVDSDSPYHRFPGVYVEIVRFASASTCGMEEIVKRMGPMDARKAERVDDGANRNLNHEQYFTRIVSA